MIGVLGTLAAWRRVLDLRRLISAAPLAKGQEGFGQLHSQTPLVREIALDLHEPGYLELWHRTALAPFVAA